MFSTDNGVTFIDETITKSSLGSGKFSLSGSRTIPSQPTNSDNPFLSLIRSLSRARYVCGDVVIGFVLWFVLNSSLTWKQFEVRYRARTDNNRVVHGWGSDTNCFKSPCDTFFFCTTFKTDFHNFNRFSAVATFLCLFSQLSIDSIDNNPSVTCLAEPMFSPFYQIASVIVA